ncbi:MAG: response regulator [Gemmatimonadales bacterium]
MPQAEEPNREAERARRIESEVDRALVAQLLEGRPTAELAHLVLIAVVGTLLWGTVAVAVLGAWAIALLVPVVMRSRWRRRALGQALSLDRVRQGTRVTAALIGVAWGLGAAVVAPLVPFQYTALILVVLSGVVAGAVANLVADRPGFQWFLAGTLGPLPVGVLVGGVDRPRLVALVLITLFGWSMLRIHRRAHRTLLERIRATAEQAIGEDQARTERAFLDALFASAPVAITVLDAGGRITGVNPRFETLFGFSAEEIRGQDLNELIVPKSELPKAGQMDRRARKGQTVLEEVERRRKDGRHIPVRALAGPIRGAGKAGLFVMYEDITDSRRARDALTQLASIVESSEDAIIGQTLDGTIVSWNAAAERTFGYAIREVKGRPAAMLVPADRLAEVAGILDRIQRREHVEHFETVRLHKDGRPIPVSLSVSLTRDIGGLISGFSMIARDISVQAAARQALQEGRDTAERATQARSAFLANMSHEIRTPMNAILGLSELLLETELAPEQRHSLGLMRSSAEGLLTLLNDILDFSKIEAEHLDLERIRFDLWHLVQSTVELLAVRARVKRIELLTDLAPAVPHQVRGDPTRLRQILTNLISNALKFTEQGEVVVSVARARTVDDRTDVRIAVRDTGIGIAADKLETIFEEFSQADASMTRRYGGTGLGLAIARRLVTLMGGELRAASELGKGSEFSFTVTLPVESGAPAPAAHPGRAELAGRRVLVVDDNATNRRIVREMLEAVGMAVAEAPSAADGFEALRLGRAAQAPFALAILDAQMPDEDGFALAERLRRDPEFDAVRLMLLTSAGHRGDGQRCRELGVQGYLTKPVSRSDLTEAVAAVLTGPPVAGAPEVVTRHAIVESRRRLHVLLAEDNPVNQEVASTMLRRRGHDVTVVSTGREAVEAVGRGRYDVVLMDVQMPEMDGFTATRAIRALPGGSALPIVACTAHALSGERERCLAEGMSGYLSKPFKAHDLFAAVEGWDASPASPSPPARDPPAPAAAPPVDLDGFRRDMRDAGAEAAVDSILDTFLSGAADRLAAVTGAIDAGDGTAIERQAHAYKSAAATIGAKELAAVLQQLEAAGKARDVPQARGLRDRLVRDSDAVTDYLRAVRGASAPRA